ncbi:hypothetical protein DYB30_011324 [Aphanomyces astaci]|uniref:DUF7769 domain-containing protein n=1 Tax=Aphanomyces astaci TaxID=112090 RepID=A0A397D3Z6_APHAT|nr:hypothetical protein DYB30_011324 [Aphanomyces astaci]
MRVSLYQDLLEKSVNGQLSRDIVRSVCTTYGVHHSTGWRIFQRGKATKTSGGIADVTARLKGNTGRPTKFAPEDIEQRIKNVPLHKRQTYRSLAAATGLSVYLLWTFVKRKWMTRRSSWTRPCLKPKQKEARRDFCLQFRTQPPNDVIGDMQDVVHLDEKWFYMTKLRRRFLVWHDEKIIPRHLQSKSHITKVMFLVAVARPRQGKDTQEDELVLDMMNLRLEEEERLEEVAVLLSNLTVISDLSSEDEFN